MQKVNEATSELSPSVLTDELLISPACVTYPLESNAVVFSLKSVAESIVNGNDFVVSTSGTKTVPVSELVLNQLSVFAGRNPLVSVSCVVN